MANPMRHKPRALVGYSQHSVQLVRTHALLAGTEKVNRHKPLVQGNVAVLKDRADSDGELLTASFALPDAFADAVLSVWLAF